MVYLHVKATVDDYAAWKSAFEGYHSARAEYGATGYQLFQATDSPEEITVLIEFDEEENARAWTEFLRGEGALVEPEMANVELSYLDMVETKQLSPA